MQSYHSTEHSSANFPDRLLHKAAIIPSTDYSIAEVGSSVNEPIQFCSQFVDSMEMYADIGTVSRYFDLHHEWFRRCAHPMKAEPIGRNSYALVIGRFGSFGYEVEPKIGLDLLPQAEGVYRIATIPVPGDVPSGYDVDFQAAMELIEVPASEIGATSTLPPLPNRITRVQWQLDLTVLIQFPRFIHALPKPLIQSTGDRLVQQVVRQVSGRLTRKVLEDFHTTHGLSVPKLARRWFFHKLESSSTEPPHKG